MVARKEISSKVCGPARTESAPHLLAWVYRELCVNIWYQFERIIHSICADLPSYKLFFVRHYTMPCAHAMCVCVLRTCKLWLNEKNKTKPKFQLGRFLWKARVINFIIIISFGSPWLWDVSRGSPSMRARHNIDIPVILGEFFFCIRRYET